MRRRARDAAFVALVMLLASVRYLPVIDDPWDLSIGSINGGGYAGGIERTYGAVGFRTLRGMPHLHHLPTSPPVPWPGSRYTNHPPLFRWLTHAIVRRAGPAERSFRLLPILFNAVAAGTLAGVALRLGGSAAGITAGGVALTAPVGLTYGWIPNYEGAVLAFGLLTFAGHLALRGSSTGRYLVVLLPFIAGIWMDWIGATFGLAIASWELLQPKGGRRLGKLLLLAAGGVVAVSAIVVLYAWWFDGVQDGLRAILAVGSATVASEGLAHAEGGWLLQHLRFWPEEIGWPLIAAAAVGLALGGLRFLRTRDELLSASLALAWPGILNVLLFRHHAAFHDFWLYYLVPPVALAAAIPVTRLCARSRPAGVALLLALLVPTALQAVGALRASRSELFPAIAAAFERACRPGDVLVFSWPLSNEGFYLDGPSIAGVLAPTELDFLKELVEAGALGSRRVLYLFPKGFEALHPDVDRMLGRWGPVHEIRWAELLREAPDDVKTLGGPDLKVVLIE